MKQKEIFLTSEGNAWFTRNIEALASGQLPEADPMVCEIIQLYENDHSKKLKVFEIGCGEGIRLGWLQSNLNADCYGIEPSVNTYHHLAELNSYKIDYRNLLSWHPHYQCITHKVRHHSQFGYTDDTNKWLAVSLIRKNVDS